MKSFQKSVSLSRCRIYNWDIETTSQIHLRIADTANHTLFQKNYHPQIDKKHVAIALAIRLTFPPDEDQVFISFWDAAPNKADHKPVSFTVGFQNLTGGDNFFAADSKNCVVNLITQSESPYKLPEIKAKIGQDQLDNFIKQREDYLHTLQTRHQPHHQNKDIHRNFNQVCTPYFEKQQQSHHHLASSVTKIQQLLAKARNLRRQDLLLPNTPNPQQHYPFPTYHTHPTLYSQAEIEQIQQELNVPHVYNQRNSLISQHYHTHRHFLAAGQAENKTKRSELVCRQRTNDSYSAFSSSQSQQMGQRMQRVKSCSSLFDAKSPFKHTYL